jgi:translation initiation factor IF-1
MVTNRQYTNDILYGTWYEHSWDYEKVDMYSQKTDRDRIELTEELRKEIAKDLIIHNGEVWEFLPGNILKVYTDDGDVILADWRLKGRGHILKIIHKDEVLEHYIIHTLKDDEMILNFYVETQARGIVKLTFNKV